MQRYSVETTYCQAVASQNMDFGQLTRVGKHDIGVSAETIPGIKPTAHVREKSSRRIKTPTLLERNWSTLKALLR